MKLLITFVCCMLIVVTSQAETIRLSEPVASDAQSETFGAPIDHDLPRVNADALASSPQEHLGAKFQIELPIAKVCQQKGCFFIAQANQRVFRVSFKDYGFFIPTDAGGKTVLLNGELITKELSAKQAAHFNSDLKSSAQSIRAGLSYEIVADSVKIPRA
jgi:hypothetical protein